MKHLNWLAICLSLLGYTVHAQVNSSFVFEGVSRNYLTYVPTSVSPDNPAPVVLVLHGFTQTAQGIMQYSGFNAIAETAGFIAVYPNGVNLSWNVGFSPTGANDVGFLNALIDTLNAKYTINLNRIYACGMSNGGFMSYRLACELSDRIAAIASVTGSMTSSTYNNCTPERPVPVLEIHGTADLIVNYNGASGIQSIDEVIDYWTGQNDCPEAPETVLMPDLVNEGSMVERSTYAPCAESSEVILMKVIGGGHTWPGSTNSGIGNTNRDINASQEIWDFFNRFSLSGNPNPTTASAKYLNINAFPNPASDVIQVSLPEEISLNETTLRLLDLQGRMVSQEMITDSTPKLFVGHLPAGMYVIEIWAGERVGRKRVVVQ